MSIDNLQLLVKKRFLRSASLSHPHTPKAIPTERFAIAFQHLQTRSHPHKPKQRFLRSASLSHSHTPKQRSHPHIPKSDSYGALRYRTSPHPKSDSYGALRYRTPNIPNKRFLRSASLSHSPHPQKRSLSHIPKAIAYL